MLITVQTIIPSLDLRCYDPHVEYQCLGSEALKIQSLKSYGLSLSFFIF